MIEGHDHVLSGHMEAGADKNVDKEGKVEVEVETKKVIDQGC